MPFSGVNGIYTLPPGTDNQVAGTPISPTMFNAYADDVEQSFNAVAKLGYPNTFSSQVTLTPSSGVSYLQIGSAGANSLDRGILFMDASASTAGLITVVPNTVGTDSVMNFYVGGSAAGDVKASLDDVGLLTLGGGKIKFPAVQSASTDPNTLDDYEEGTWTPGRTGFTETGGGSISLSGTYTKIGRLVTVYATLTPAGGAQVAAVAGSSTITNLPFTPSKTVPGTFVDITTENVAGLTSVRSAGMILVTSFTPRSSVISFTASYEVA